MIRDVVNELECDFLEAGDGTTAQQLIEEYCDQLGIVLVDWNVPNLDGYQLLQWMKADDRLKDIPVVFVTALGQPERKDEALAAGAYDYIQKPFDPETLKSSIQKYMRT